MTVSLIVGASRTEFLFRGGGGVPPPLGSNPPWSLAGECDFSSMKGAQEHEEEQLYSPALQPNSKKCQKTFDHTQHMVKKHWQRQDDGTR